MNSTLRAMILTLIFSSMSVRAEDWPQWRGPDRTAHVPDGIAVPAKLPDTASVLWRTPLGNGLASPVVSGGKVFYLDNQQEKEVVHAADAMTGNVLWSTPLDAIHKDSQSVPGPRTTPTADGDRVYAQSCRGELQCLSAADGKVIWQTNFVKDFGATFIGEKGKAEGSTRHGNTGSPIIDGDHLIAQVGGPQGASMVCFDKLTGRVIWKSQNDIPGYAAPMIATILGVKQFIAFTAEGVIGLSTVDGKLLWRVPVKTALARHVTTPLVVGDIVVVASHQAGLIGIKITKEGEDFKADRVWTTMDSAINFSSPVAVGNYLYGTGPAKNLICVDVQTGKQSWSQDGLFSGNAGKTHSGMIVMGANILVLTDDGQLALVAADPHAYHEISRLRVCGLNWCEPAYVGGKLYLRDAKELLCIPLVP